MLAHPYPSFPCPSQVSDKGVGHLVELPKLMHLCLGRTKVRDEGLSYIAQITTLHELQFEREAMTGALGGAAAVRGL